MLNAIDVIDPISLLEILLGNEAIKQILEILSNPLVALSLLVCAFFYLKQTGVSKRELDGESTVRKAEDDKLADNISSLKEDFDRLSQSVSDQNANNLAQFKDLEKRTYDIAQQVAMTKGYALAYFQQDKEGDNNNNANSNNRNGNDILFSEILGDAYKSVPDTDRGKGAQRGKQ